VAGKASSLRLAQGRLSTSLPLPAEGEAPVGMTESFLDEREFFEIDRVSLRVLLKSKRVAFVATLENPAT
jgi:hypothetical protein